MHHKLLASHEQTKLDSVDLLRGLFLSHGLGISAPPGNIDRAAVIQAG